MKKILFTILLLANLSCNNKTQNGLQDIYDDYTFSELKANSDRIVIKLYDSINMDRIMNDKTKARKIFTINKRQIESFKKVFEKARKTSYCCCPRGIYSIAFYDKNKQLDIYYADTIQFRDSIRVYQRSYQFSYIVEKRKWKNYLAEIGNGN